MFGCKLSIICSQQKRQLVAVLLDAHCYLVEAFYMEIFFFHFSLLAERRLVFDVDFLLSFNNDVATGFTIMLDS